MVTHCYCQKNESLQVYPQTGFTSGYLVLCFTFIWSISGINGDFEESILCFENEKDKWDVQTVINFFVWLFAFSHQECTRVGSIIVSSCWLCSQHMTNLHLPLSEKYKEQTEIISLT